jgi:mono/diheme cytochrome c family protein
MLTRKFPCPSCGVGLKVAESLPDGKKIDCPKCGVGFRVPDADDPSPAPTAVSARPRKAAPPPEEDEDLEQEVERRPAPGKRRKKRKKAASNTPLILGLVIGGAVLLVGTAVALAVFRPWERKTEPVAANNPNPTRPAPSVTAGGPSSADTAQAAGDSQHSASGKKVYDSLDCSRCHSVGGFAGGGGQKKGRGPDLSRVGANPTHTVEWLSDHVRNPRSHRPQSRMPGYEEKISREDLRSLAEYLASLK